MLSKCKRLLKSLYIKHKNKKRDKAVIKSNKYKFKYTGKEYAFCKKYGFSISEYKLYQLDKNDHKAYISTLESFYPRYNNGKMTIISDNKFVFPYILSRYFKTAKNYAYIDRGDIIPVEDSCVNKENLIEFLKEHQVILKPIGGWDGFGIKKIVFKDGVFFVNNEETSAEKLRGNILGLKEYLMQEVVIQHEYADNLYKDSLNTIRVISAKKEDGLAHEIICAVQRIGTITSAPADNFAQGGISSIIDIETGLLSEATGATTFGSDGDRIFYSQHPTSGGQISGIRVPFWDEIKEKIVIFTQQFPFFKFIAWDIAIGQNGEIFAIETNMKSSLDLFQVHGGMKDTKLYNILLKMKK